MNLIFKARTTLHIKGQFLTLENFGKYGTVRCVLQNQVTGNKGIKVAVCGKVRSQNTLNPNSVSLATAVFVYWRVANDSVSSFWSQDIGCWLPLSGSGR